MIKKLLLQSLIILPISIIAQNNRKKLSGKIYDNNGAIENIHVFNLSSKKTTYTNPRGIFELFARANDSLKITGIGYKTKYITIQNDDFGITRKQISLEKETIVLDEVKLTNRLTGFLELDLKKTPKNLKEDIFLKNTNFSEIDMGAPMDEDYIDKYVRPPAINTDPIAVGVGGSISIPMGGSEELWRLRREINYKKSLPNLLLKDLGKKFFFEELKIPQNKYHHFLAFCNPLGIEEKYQNNKKIEVINILKKESVKYLKIINEN